MVAGTTSPSSLQLQQAIQWYPPSYDIRVVSIPVPQFAPIHNLLRSAKTETLVRYRIQHPDDAIIKVTVSNHSFDNPSGVSGQCFHLQLAALCGSDLHIYRGHGNVAAVCVSSETPSRYRNDHFTSDTPAVMNLSEK